MSELKCIFAIKCTHLKGKWNNWTNLAWKPVKGFRNQSHWVPCSRRESARSKVWSKNMTSHHTVMWLGKRIMADSEFSLVSLEYPLVCLLQQLLAYYNELALVSMCSSLYNSVCFVFSEENALLVNACVRACACACACAVCVCQCVCVCVCVCSCSCASTCTCACVCVCMCVYVSILYSNYVPYSNHVICTYFQLNKKMRSPNVSLLKSFWASYERLHLCVSSMFPRRSRKGQRKVWTTVSSQLLTERVSKQLYGHRREEK